MKPPDRQRGTLLGLAVGDALGAAVEFEMPGAFEPVTGYRGGGPHGLGPGEWTDDTSMALALADSIAQVGWDLNDQAGRYVTWWREGRYSVNGRCFDIGITTRSALAPVLGRPAMRERPAIARNGPAATVRSCGWPRCRSGMSVCSLIDRTNLSGWQSNPACRPTPVRNALRPVRISAWFSRH